MQRACPQALGERTGRDYHRRPPGCPGKTIQGEGDAVPEQGHDQGDVSGEELLATWKAIRDELRSSLPESTFRIWLEPVRAAAIRGSTLYLTAPPKLRTWVERRYSDLLERTAATVGQFDSVRFVDGTEETDDSEGWKLPQAKLNPDYSFDRFVIGPGNRIAHAAALAIAEAPGQAYNPLFLHGPPGLGKTHLLGAVANYVRARDPNLRVHYTTAEEFTNGFVGALQSGHIDAFKTAYRQVEVLLIDDVQFLEGKTRTADELFHTFNALHEAGAQVVLSADRMPSELSELADRLRDRFDWGLVAELMPPDELTRVTFLNRLSNEGAAGGAEPEALDQIARRVTENLRLLRGALTRVVAFSSMTGTPITRGLVDEALPGEKPARQLRAEPTAEEIQREVCSRFGIDRDALLSQSRAGDLVEARQLAMYLSRELTALSLPQIARAFNRRDHTTVMHALRRVESRLETDPGLRETAADLSSSLSPAPGGHLPDRDR